MNKHLLIRISVLFLYVISSFCFFSVASAEENAANNSIFSNIVLPPVPEVPELPTLADHFLTITNILREPAAEVGDVLISIKDDFKRDIVGPMISLPSKALIFASEPIRGITRVTITSANKASVGTTGFIGNVWNNVVDSIKSLFTTSTTTTPLTGAAPARTTPKTTTATTTNITVNSYYPSQNISSPVVVAGTSNSLLLRTISLLTSRIDALEGRPTNIINNTYVSNQTDAIGDSISRLMTANNTNITNIITNSIPTYDQSNVAITGGSISGVGATTTDLEVGGAFSFNGLFGSSGQVLASQGTGTSPVWQSLAAAATNTDQLPEGLSNLYFTDSRARNSLSTADALSFATSTGVFSVTSGYNIPLIASTTEWASKISSPWAASGSDIYYTSGNVGIGTTSPVAKLDVWGNFNVATSSSPLFNINTGTGNVSIGSSTVNSTFSIIGDRAQGLARYQNMSSTGYDSFDFLDNLGVFQFSFGHGNSDTGAFANLNYINANGGNPISFMVSNTEAMRIASDRNIGIGTTTPAAKLHILGTSEQFRLGYDASNYMKYTVGSTSGLTETPGINGTSAWNFTKADGITSIFNIDSTNGRVGIGTTTPGQPLDVWGNLQIGTSSSPALFVNTATSQSVFARGTNTLPSVTFSNDTGTGFYNDVAGQISVPLQGSGVVFSFIGNMLRMGNGVGLTWSSTAASTNSADTGIHRNASGAVEINNGTAGSWRDLIVRNLSMGTTSISTTLTLQGAADKDIFDFASSTGTSLLHLTQAGNLGIGTTTPFEKLTVVGNVYATGNASFASTTLTNFTEGSIPFIGGGGALAQNNSNLFWDNSAKNLGIGTASPLYAIHIKKTGYVGFAVDSLTSGNPYFSFQLDSADVGGFDYSRAANAFEVQSNGALNFQTGGVTNRMSISDVGVTSFAYGVNANANLAISGSGALSGNALLEVGNVSNVPSNTSAMIVGGKTFRFGSDAGNANYGTYMRPDYLANAALTFGTREGGVDTDTFTLTNGRLGIGTTTPSEKLSVNGNLKVWDESGSGISKLMVRTGASQSTNPQISIQDSSGNTVWGSTYGQSAVTAYPNFRSDSSGNLVLNSKSGVALFLQRDTEGDVYLQGDMRVGSAKIIKWANVTDPYGATNDLGISRNAAGVLEINNGASGTYRDLNLRTITGSGTSTFAGNVGIGTTTPSMALDIPAFNTSNSQLRVGSLEFQPYALNNAWIGENIYYNGGGFSRRVDGAAGLFYFQGSEGQFRFFSSGTATSSISANSPAQMKVHANGSFAAGGSINNLPDTFTGAHLYIDGPSGNVGISSTTPAARFAVVGNAGSTTNLFVVASSTNTQLFTVTSGGKVGIGTTTPGQQLTISGNFQLPSSTTTAGVIYSGADRYIHNFGTARNFFAGVLAGNLTSTSSDNVGLGYSALKAVTSGGNNVAIGSNALALNTSGGTSVAIGTNALAAATTGGNNTAIGYRSLVSVTTGSSNIGIANQNALASLTTGQFNIAIGGGAVNASVSTVANIGIGDYALYNATGNSNTAMGYAAFQNSTGAGNTGFGRQAGNSITTGANNTFVGFQAGYTDGTITTTNSVSNATAIGYNAQVQASNSLILGGTGAYAVNVGIGTTSPSAKLDIYGTAGSSNIFAISSSTNSRLLTVAASGNVGIGIASPQTILSVGAVTGALSTTAGTGALTVSTGNTIVYAGENSSASGASSGSFAALYSNDGAAMASGDRLGGFLLGGSSSATNLRNSGMIGAYAAQNWVDGSAYGTDIAFETVNNSATSRTEKMRITANGDVGIGTTTPGKQLTTTGTVQFAGITGGTLTADAVGNITASSDENLKNIESEFTRGLEDIRKINPISYRWKEETGYDTGNIYSGFSAQNLQLAIPEAVLTNSSGFLTLQDRPILATAINAIKEIGAIFSKIEDGIAYMKTVIVEKFTIGSSAKPAGITIFDEITGDPYCIKVMSGAMKTLPGTCDNAVAASINEPPVVIEEKIPPVVVDEPPAVENTPPVVDSGEIPPTKTATPNETDKTAPEEVKNLDSNKIKTPTEPAAEKEPETTAPQPVPETAPAPSTELAPAPVADSAPASSSDTAGSEA